MHVILVVFVGQTVHEQVVLLHGSLVGVVQTVENILPWAVGGDEGIVGSGNILGEIGFGLSGDGFRLSTDGIVILLVGFIILSGFTYAERFVNRAVKLKPLHCLFPPCNRPTTSERNCM